MGPLATRKEETVRNLEVKGTWEHDLIPFAMLRGALFVQLLTDIQSRGKGEAIRENSTPKVKTHKGKICEAKLHCEMSLSKGLKQEV